MLLCGHNPTANRVAEAEEGDDGEHLDAREPEFELTERPDREQVGGGHQHHQTEREQPQRRVDPVGENLCAGDCLEADNDDPEVPVQPADRETGPPAQCVARVVGERPGRRMGGRHFTEHAHHQHDQHTGERVAEEGTGARVGDHHPGAHEQAGADDAADRDHGQMALLETLGECFRRTGHHLAPYPVTCEDRSPALLRRLSAEAHRCAGGPEIGLAGGPAWHWSTLTGCHSIRAAPPHPSVRG
jgi:hypothetical protein